MLRFKLSILSVCLFLMAGLTSAQDKIFLAGNELKIGMSKKEVLNKLNNSGQFVISEDSSGKEILITKKQVGETGKEEIGRLTFTEGKLIQAWKPWGDFNQAETREFANALFSIITNLNENGYHTANVSVWVSREPDGILKKMTFEFGQRKVDIYINEIEGFSKEVQLNERLAR